MSETTDYYFWNCWPVHASEWKSLGAFAGAISTAVRCLKIRQSWDFVKMDDCFKAALVCLVCVVHKLDNDTMHQRHQEHEEELYAQRKDSITSSKIVRSRKGTSIGRCTTKKGSKFESFWKLSFQKMIVRAIQKSMSQTKTHSSKLQVYSDKTLSIRQWKIWWRVDWNLRCIWENKWSLQENTSRLKIQKYRHCSYGQSGSWISYTFWCSKPAATISYYAKVWFFKIGQGGRAQRGNQKRVLSWRL